MIKLVFIGLIISIFFIQSDKQSVIIFTRKITNDEEILSYFKNIQFTSDKEFFIPIKKNKKKTYYTKGNSYQLFLAPYYKQKVQEYGYDFEEHKIATDDGYILNAWRIPGRSRESSFIRSKRKPVLLQHGLLDSSYTWLMLNSKDSLALILAENGFDVWMSNSRGNIFSSEHVNPDYDSNSFYSSYWDFSFHEMALYDFPANILYIKQTTEKEKVIYLGHSQGSIQYFINYTLDPEFIEQNIEKFVALGTVVNLFNTTSRIVNILHRTSLTKFLETIHVKNIFSVNDFTLNLVSKFCKNLPFICRPVVQYFAEDTPTNRIDYDYIKENFFFMPGGTSVRNINHWIQLFATKKFTQFDYGESENMNKYKSSIPPEYDMDRIKNYNVPSYLTMSNSDPFAKKEDLEYLLKHLDMKKIKLKHLDNYNHLDYLWSSDAKDDLYAEILEFLFK